MKNQNQYNISENETLILFKYEIYNEGYYIPIIEYEVYHPITKIPMDLYYCKHMGKYLLLLNSIK